MSETNPIFYVIHLGTNKQSQLGWEKVFREQLVWIELWSATGFSFVPRLGDGDGIPASTSTTDGRVNLAGLLHWNPCDNTGPPDEHLLFDVLSILGFTITDPRPFTNTAGKLVRGVYSLVENAERGHGVPPSESNMIRSLLDKHPSQILASPRYSFGQNRCYYVDFGYCPSHQERRKWDDLLRWHRYEKAWKEAGFDYYSLGRRGNGCDYNHDGFIVSAGLVYHVAKLKRLMELLGFEHSDSRFSPHAVGLFRYKVPLPSNEALRKAGL